MADHNKTGDPASDILRASGRLAPRPGKTPLAFKLVPVADKIRALASKFGLRPYRVFLVHGTWTGEREGQGQLLRTSRRELLPTPRVRSMDSVRQYLRATGRTEDGDIYIDQISASIPEDDMLGKTPDLRDPSNPRSALEVSEFWWEVVEERPSDPKPVIRRFVPASAPDLRRDSLAWSINLTKQDYDPSREGDGTLVVMK